MTVSVRGQNLTAKGLLGSRPRLGTWVQPEQNWNLLDPDVLGWLLERKYPPALLIEFTELRFSIRITNRYKGVQLASVADHKKAADAIIGGRPVAAGEAMRKLIQEALDLINKREAVQVARRLAANAPR